jgi:hypothetical protein
VLKERYRKAVKLVALHLHYELQATDQAEHLQILSLGQYIDVKAKYPRCLTKTSEFLHGHFGGKEAKLHPMQSSWIKCFFYAGYYEGYNKKIQK